MSASLATSLGLVYDKINAIQLAGIFPNLWMLLHHHGTHLYVQHHPPCLQQNKIFHFQYLKLCVQYLRCSIDLLQPHQHVHLPLFSQVSTTENKILLQLHVQAFVAS
jgi:hypothetical protein